MSDPAEEQRREKYRHHDLVPADIKELDFLHIKSSAIRKFVNTPESDQVKLIVSSFMDYLTSKGYRIMKKWKSVELVKNQKMKLNLNFIDASANFVDLQNG